MKKKVEEQPAAREWSGWALYNWGNFWSAHGTRKAAVEEAERATGKPWSECREYFRVEKARVTPIL